METVKLVKSMTNQSIGSSPRSEKFSQVMKYLHDVNHSMDIKG